MGAGKNERSMKFNIIDFLNNEVHKYEMKLEASQVEQN